MIKWALIIVAYVACSEPVRTDTGKEFDTQEACVEWAKANKAQLGISSETQFQCDPKQ